jgi:hypothetical protein
MALTLTLMSELEAVNAMLETVGETPVSSLPSTGVTEAYIAREILHRTSREVQGLGLNFNTDTRYELSRDVNSHVLVPSNALRIDDYYYYSSLVPRLDVSDDFVKLYDRENHTFVLTSNPFADVVWFFKWEGLPDAVRNFIYISAARKFQVRYQSSEVIHRLTQEDETRARAEMMSAEYRADDDSIINSPGAYNVVNRRV